MKDIHLEIENEVYQEPLFDDVADDINFTGAMSLCGITITEETVEVDD